MDKETKRWRRDKDKYMVKILLHKNIKTLKSLKKYSIGRQAECALICLFAYLSYILSEELVIPAVEFDCIFKGVIIHILGFGINIDNEEIKSLYAPEGIGCRQDIYRLIKLRNAKEVIDKIKGAEGIPVLAHPACYWCFDLDKFIKQLVDLGLEGLETYYPYRGFRGVLKFHSADKVKEIADKYGLIKTGGTDSHGKKLL